MGLEFISRTEKTLHRSWDQAFRRLSSAGLLAPSVGGLGRGLMRSELDRAVSTWSTMNGSEQPLYANAKLLAKEVTSLAFQYFDGTAWTTDWDSSAMGGLPVADQVVPATHTLPFPASNAASPSALRAPTCRS